MNFVYKCLAFMNCLKLESIQELKVTKDLPFSMAQKDAQTAIQQR